jgi:hypothetical protein
MRSILFAITVLLVAACTGTLTEEQRKSMKEQMELHKIKRVTDAEITEAAFKRGRDVAQALAYAKSDSAKVDSIVRSHHGRIVFSFPGDKTSTRLENEIVAAFLETQDIDAGDNVQKVRRQDNAESDSLLYSKPVYGTLNEKSHQLIGVWNIWLSRKALILSMGK